jgi:hypothetical protein
LNNVKSTRKLIIERVPLKENSNRRDEYQGTFALTIAGARNASALHVDGMKSLIIR